MLKAKNRSDKILKEITVLIFIVFLGTGLFIFDDYGVTVDEPMDRQTGLVNLKFILQDLFQRPIPDELLTIPDLLYY